MKTTTQLTATKNFSSTMSLLHNLLAFFNIAIKSLRTIKDFSQTKQAQKYLSISKICKSTLSDFNVLAKPERLQSIIKALQKELTDVLTHG